ncbi:hypothetical protein B0H65DRAFT_123065 [Neurospora tetraspora]|uniref:Uncharacterized protein n=1 Tax=Neurospora tetraspora TaxID=94610 RepID=A0AAE0JM00_9PEZI|nr:hypothetical protein B0H65DRAFT_123065 [Neurospora tetraspora]
MVGAFASVLSTAVLRYPVLCGPSRRFDVEPRSKSSTANAGGRTARELYHCPDQRERGTRAQSGQGAEMDIEATSFRGRGGSRRRRACSRHSSRSSFAWSIER